MVLTDEQKNYLQTNFGFDDFENATDEQTEKAMDLLGWKEVQAIQEAGEGELSEEGKLVSSIITAFALAYGIEEEDDD